MLTPSMLIPYLRHLLTREPLAAHEAEMAMSVILEEADPLETAAFLAILSYRGATAGEIAGMVRALETRSVRVSLPFPVLDIVGTGGDGAHTVNISTGSCFLAAACGIPIAKHGNRSVSSRSGSADVLEALGIDIELPAETVRESLQECRIAFMFAPLYHPCFQKVRSIRRSLQIPTVFNMLGPLLNPARAPYALIGVARPDMLELMAETVRQLGYHKRALVFHGSGLDELSPMGPISAYDVRGGKIERLEIDPQALGFSPCALHELQGGDAQLNATILEEAFSGKRGVVADALVFNAGAALWIFNRTPSLKEGIHIARCLLDDGAAHRVLTQWKAFSQQKRKV